MGKEVFSTEKAPKAIGPYVQAAKGGNTIYVSGQLGIDMQSGELGADVVSQAKNSLKNMEQILLAAGSNKENVLKCVIFLTDMNDFAAVNEVYAEFFDGSYPARSCVAVAALPKKALVEIECIALA
jgi:putative endoribonuclease L-PSP